MNRLLLAAALLALAPAAAGAQDDEALKARAGKHRVEERGYFTRLLYDNVLVGTQFNEPYLVRADCVNALAVLTPWDALGAIGPFAAWNPRHEPLTYFHRTGPVGAVFHHVRTRKGGADAAAPVGVLGLEAGTVAAYARRGQAVTFYESHAELKGLVADTDRYFTYLGDARHRGATVEVKFGPLRRTLAADADKRFAVLIVEMYETGFDPGDLLTLEAVKLYADRLAPDGVAALHVSSKDYRLEPVVARIARELKLVGRVWNDDSENRPGKTAASWLVLARSEAALGPLAGSVTDQVRAFGTKNEALGDLLRKYPDGHGALAAVRAEWLGPPTDGEPPTSLEVALRHGPQAATVYVKALALRDAGEPDATLARLTEAVCGRKFQSLMPGNVPLRTDAHRPQLPRFDYQAK